MEYLKIPYDPKKKKKDRKGETEVLKTERTENK